MRFRRAKGEPPKSVGERAPSAEPPEPAQTPAAQGPTVERMTAIEWARKHQMNAVMAERAAMYAGKRNEPVTEEEFLEMLRRTDV